VPKYCNEFI